MTISELICGEIPKGELVHPNGFRIACTYREAVITRSIGPVTNWVQSYVQTQMPWWVVTEVDSGPWASVKQENIFHDTAKEIETMAENREEGFIYKSELMGQFPASDVQAVIFTFRPVGIKDIIDGYPFRSETP